MRRRQRSLRPLGRWVLCSRSSRRSAMSRLSSYLCVACRRACVQRSFSMVCDRDLLGPVTVELVLSEWALHLAHDSEMLDVHRHAATPSDTPNVAHHCHNAQKGPRRARTETDTHPDTTRSRSTLLTLTSPLPTATTGERARRRQQLEHRGEDAVVGREGKRREGLPLDVRLLAGVVLCRRLDAKAAPWEEEEVLRVLVAGARRGKVLVRNSLVELRLQVGPRVEGCDVRRVGRVAPAGGEAELAVLCRELGDALLLRAADGVRVCVHPEDMPCARRLLGEELRHRLDHRHGR
mmetsp:Transcript_36923/g.119484  ORF Transcript_36923/g.119484 Transcript_36923/m.119484 type:complete len:293 (-) Transcript_36923:555-1433(-)